MTIRTRLTVWYSVILCVVAAVAIGAAMYEEFVIEQRHHHHKHEPKTEVEITNEDLMDILTSTIIPAALVGLIGGWLLTRRALVPITALTNTVEKIQESNLDQK